MPAKVVTTLTWAVVDEYSNRFETKRKEVRVRFSRSRFRRQSISLRTHPWRGRNEIKLRHISTTETHRLQITATNHQPRVSDFLANVKNQTKRDVGDEEGNFKAYSAKVPSYVLSRLIE